MDDRDRAARAENRHVRTLTRILALCTLLSLLTAHGEPAVARRHVAATSTFDSGILHVERFGKPAGRSIVFIPALFAGSWQWNAQINSLSSKYDVLVVTLPGFDGRPMVTGGDLMQRAAQSLHLLMTAHNLNRPVVVGHSLGGTLAVFFAERYPHDASGLVTVEGGYPAAATQALRDARVATAARPYEGITQSDLGPALRKNILQYTITSRADVDAVEPLAARSDPSAIVAWMRAALSLDLTSNLHRITVPFTAIIPFDAGIDPYQGFTTKAQKRAAYERWADHTRYPEVIVLSPSRHFVMFDQPEKFADALSAAISR